MEESVDLKVTEYYHDKEESKRAGNSVYFNVGDIRRGINKGRAKILVDAGVCEYYKEEEADKEEVKEGKKITKKNKKEDK